MATVRRKDSRNRVLREGEHERANGSYEYKWRDKRGRRHSVYAKTLEGLREKEEQVLRDLLDGVKPAQKDMTVNDLYHRWRQLKKGLKANTFRNYQYAYEKFVEPDFGKTRLADLRRSDVRAFYIMLIRKHHMKVASVDCIHTVLHQVLELGVGDEYLRYNPSDNALKELKRLHSGDSEKRRALTQAEQNLFEEYLYHNGRYNRWYPVFTVMLWTGMRVGEVTGLRWCDIDLDQGTISVNHTLVFYSKGRKHGGSVYAVNTPKTKAGERIIPMLPKVKRAFLIEKEFQDSLEIEGESVIDGYSDFIFLNRFGAVHNNGSLNKALQRIIRDCNREVLARSNGNPDAVMLPQISNHTLRHTFTTRMCEAGVKIKAMQDILWHADAETTMNIYADAAKELKKREMINFEQYFHSLEDEE